MLPQSLRSLLAQDYAGPVTIVLVDDQSEDGTADVARASPSPLDARSWCCEVSHYRRAGPGRSGPCSKV